MFMSLCVFAEVFHYSSAERSKKDASDIQKDIVSNLAQPTAAGSSKILLNLDADTNDHEFTQQEAFDNNDEGSVVFGAEGVDIVTHPVSSSIHPGSSNSLQKLIRMGTPSPLLRTSDPMASAMAKNATPPFLTLPVVLEHRNTSLLTVLDGEEARQPPAFYAILSALGASLGYIVMMIVRCKGLLDELAPKQPIREFMRSNLECPTRKQKESRRKNGRTGARFCSTNMVGRIELPLTRASGAQGDLPEHP